MHKNAIGSTERMSAESTPKRPISAYAPLAFLILYGITGGATFSLAKIAASHGVHPAGYTFWQCAGAALVMLTIAAIRRRMPPLSVQAIGFFAVTGVLCLAIPNVSMYLVVMHIPAGTMAIIVATMPLMTYGLSMPLRLEKFHTLRFVGIWFGFAGALLILTPSASLGFSSADLWIGLAFVTPLLFSVGNIYVARSRPAELDGLTLTAGMLAMATVALGMFVFATDTFYLPRAAMGVAEWIILLQIVASSIGYLLFFEIIRRAGPVYFSQIGYIVTISGTTWGMLLHDEILDAAVWLAAGLILCGVALVNSQEKPKAANAFLD